MPDPFDLDPLAPFGGTPQADPTMVANAVLGLICLLLFCLLLMGIGKLVGALLKFVQRVWRRIRRKN